MTFETGRATVADPSAVVSRDAFADFVQAALLDYEKRGHAEWENATLERFLDALGAVARSCPLEAHDSQSATWRLFAEMLVAATGYE